VYWFLFYQVGYVRKHFLIIFVRQLASLVIMFMIFQACVYDRRCDIVGFVLLEMLLLSSGLYSLLLMASVTALLIYVVLR